jgi:peptide/nickel transport system permease protein
MAAFLIRRLIQGAIVVALVATIVFLLIHAAPGDPFGAAMEDASISEGVRQRWREAYGLDRPLAEQYARYVTAVFRGDLGFSFSRQRPVADVLRDAFPNTLLLMATGLFAGLLAGVAIALIQVRNRGRYPDRILGGISLVFLAVPDFWLALLVLVSLAYWLPGNVFPIGGAVEASTYDSLSIAGRAFDRLRHLILPAFTLALLYFPIIARHQRAALLETLPSEYVTTARAKGLDERDVIRRHALRNAVLPIVSLLGIAFPALLTGAVFIEKVFSWPGMGLVIIGSIQGRDYPLLTACVILGSAFVVAGSILADVVYRVLDPRIGDER